MGRHACEREVWHNITREKEGMTEEGGERNQRWHWIGRDAIFEPKKKHPRPQKKRPVLRKWQRGYYYFNVPALQSKLANLFIGCVCGYALACLCVAMGVGVCLSPSPGGQLCSWHPNSSDCETQRTGVLQTN